jgi:hypothetical protein
VIKTRNFWIGVIHLAVIPLLLVDVAEHYINWQKEVKEEIIAVVHNSYSFNKQQKAQVLDRVFAQNERLTFLVYIKCFSSLVLLALSIFFFRRYRNEEKLPFWKPALSGVTVIVCFLVV